MEYSRDKTFTSFTDVNSGVDKTRQDKTRQDKTRQDTHM